MVLTQPETFETLAVGAGVVAHAQILASWGDTLHSLGRYSEARPTLERALALFEANLPETDPALVDALRPLADVERDTGRLERSGELYARSLALIERRWGPESAAIPWVISGDALRLVAAGRLGQKSGAGFYDYEAAGGKSRKASSPAARALVAGLRDGGVSTPSDADIVERMMLPLVLESIRALEEGAGSVEDIDKGMVLGCGHPMGPLTLLDYVGLDTTYYIANIMFDEFRERRFAPPPLLKRMVQAGMYGRKSGKGFYDYAQEPPRPTPGLA